MACLKESHESLKKPLYRVLRAVNVLSGGENSGQVIIYGNAPPKTIKYGVARLKR